jgi:hypothetical protein
MPLWAGSKVTKNLGLEMAFLATKVTTQEQCEIGFLTKFKSGLWIAEAIFAE